MDYEYTNLAFVDIMVMDLSILVLELSVMMTL